ncbi:MAG: zinc-ribbon domain-containing protein [Desulfuromonadaceae bacterium]|jgi:uncharacterized membrane protein YvbJ
MFCSKCGKQIPDDSTFCPFCGNSTAYQDPVKIQESLSQPTQEVSLVLNVGIVIATMFIPLVGLIMGLIYIKKPSPAKKKAGKVWLWVALGAFILNILLIAGGGY